MTSAAPSANATSATAQPRALYVLFLTEMWERFSYYGMRALLVLYMQKHLHWDQPKRSAVYGWYTGLVWLTPFFGGMLADRYLGYRTAVIVGGVIMMFGHFLMAVDRVPVFFAALGLLTIGVGALKPNVSTVVGKLYAPGDPRRDRGFTIFYMGLQIGAFIAPLICGYLGERIGWHWGFASAGVGMALGVITFVLGQPLLKDVDLGVPERQAKNESAPRRALTHTERMRVAALVIVSVFVIFFWAAYEQSGNTMTLWADANTNRMLPVFLATSRLREIPASWFQSVNPGFVVILTPVMAAIWGWFARRGGEPSTPAKMMIGLVLLGLSLAAMVGAAALNTGPGDKASMWWLMVSYALMSAGEIAVSPVGLSLVTKLAPARLGGMLMGVWFLSNMFGNKLAGVIGGIWDNVAHTTFFAIFVASSLVAAGLFAALLPTLKKMMQGAD
jgi:POT family proton-dependent oligopeptide transporter